MYTKNYLFILLMFLFASCYSQSQRSESEKIIGGRCEGCEALLEYGDKVLTSVDTLPAFEENSPKLRITGTVFQSDGQTPASNVILYVYHTDRQGIYPKKGDEQGWGKRHGFIRGWVQTGADGKYTFYTFRPGAYPGRTVPEHIHITLKEPGKNEYYIDDFLFDDDPLLTKNERNRVKKRGGSGIVNLTPDGGLLTINRDIILGLNIPDYY